MKLKRSFSKSEKILLGLLVLIIIAAAYYYMVQMPVSEGISKAENDIANYETENVILDAKNQKLQAMKTELEEIEAKGIETIVPKYDNLSAEIAFLNTTLFSTTNYQMSFTLNKGDSNILRRVAQISFECPTYKDAKSLINKLENCDYICKVTDVIISPKDAANKSVPITDGAVSVSLSATFFERT